MSDVIDIWDRQSVGMTDEGMRPGSQTAKSEGRRIVETHRRRLRARTYRDATAEKYLIHVDGEGDAQWMDLLHGERLRMVPKLRGGPRHSNNQLRPITQNMVAHLTTQPVRFVADARRDKDSRERALLDTVLVNHHVRKQKWNVLLSEAKWIAACYGFCPIHQFVRDDASEDFYEGVQPAGPARDPLMGGDGQEMAEALFQPPPVMLDAFVGNPWAMTFDSGARRWSIHRAIYERVLPTDLVRHAFGRDDIDGDTRRSSASQFQLISRRWTGTNSMHGTATLSSSESNEELTGLLYEEVPPGILTEPPFNRHGRLRIVVLQGASTAQREVSRGSGSASRAELLWEGVLPGATFSWVPFYSMPRADDVLGKPFVADLDDLQVQLNQLEALALEYLRRASRPPLASTGALKVDTIDYFGDTVLELEPTGLTSGDTELRYLEYPAQHLVFLGERRAGVLEAMYRIGAYQAASRGEAKSGTSGKALVALQSADDSILGPMAMQTKGELEEFAGLSWTLMKEFLDVPMVVDAAGKELDHLAEPYVDRTQLSHSPPTFRLVSGFGTSTEARAQQLLNLVGVRDANGEQIISARQVRAAWPDQTLFDEEDDPQEYRERHARVVNQTIERVAERIRASYPQIPDEMNDPMVVQVAQYWGWPEVDRLHPILMDDDPQTHLETLSLITQDDTQDALARHIAMLRQDQYWQWLAQQQQAAAAQQAGMPADQDAMQPPRAGGGGGGAIPAASQPGRGSPGAESMIEQDRQLEQRANQQLRSA